MSRLSLLIALVVIVLGPGSAEAQLTDLYGDPLPPGAVARLGTVRLQPGGSVTHLGASPDGKRLASFSRSGYMDSAFTLWDAGNGRELRRVELIGTRVYAVRWAADGRAVAVLQLGDDSFYLWDFADERADRPPAIERSWTLSAVGGQDNERRSSFALSRDGKRLAGGRAGWHEKSRPIDLWQVQTGKRLDELTSVRTVGPQEGD